MADRYEDRYRNEEWRRDRGFGRDERGPLERGADEVRSWFGDDEAERRRRMDEARYGRDWDRYGRDVDRNWDHRTARDADERGGYGRDWDYGHRMGLDYGRSRGWGHEQFGSSRQSPWREYNEPAYYRSSYTALGPNTYRATTPMREYDDTGTYRHGFSGRGPRGYQRSDERIREDVCDRLCDDPWVDASDVDVAVRNGEVTLTGHVRERSDKRRVEDVIESVSGVREVHNNLHVGTTSREQTTNTGATGTGTTSRR